MSASGSDLTKEPILESCIYQTLTKQPTLFNLKFLRFTLPSLWRRQEERVGCLGVIWSLTVSKINSEFLAVIWP